MSIHQGKESSFARPMLPYIGLDDPHTKDFFTKNRIRKHLRRAGLLNRNGEILSQAEYDSKIKDVVVGRENQRKLDDALTEVLDDMAKEHWGYARNHMDDIKKDVLHQLRRIEEQYRRRVQPITIRHVSDRDSSMKWMVPKTSDQSSVPESSTRSPTLTLPAIQSSDQSRRSRPNRASNTRSFPNKDRFRKDWNSASRKDDSDDDLRRTKQSFPSIEKKPNGTRRQHGTLRGKHEEQKQYTDELLAPYGSAHDQTELIDDNEAETDAFVPISTVIRRLNDRILNLEASFIESPQAAINQITAQNEEKTIERERIIENALHGIDNKCEQMENQLIQLLKQLEQPFVSTPQTNANQLSRTTRAYSIRPTPEERVKLDHSEQEVKENANNGGYELVPHSTTLEPEDRPTAQQPYLQENSNLLNHQSEQKLARVSRLHLPNRSSSTGDPVMELQAVMPFTEFLPTFDMFHEKEWE